MIHVAIVSHGHEALLIAKQMGGLLPAVLADDDIRLWVKDNRPAASLADYCKTHGIFYTDAQAGLGFGENNNLLFQTIEQNCGFKQGDIFLVMNPDVSIEAAKLHQFAAQMITSGHAIACLNLFRDAAMQIEDQNIRHFPGMLSILQMPVRNSFSETYNKDQITEALTEMTVEWASGAFLGFTPEHFKKLGGFDKRYFMYFEDVDICYRSRKDLQQAVYFYPQLKAIHSAAHRNRNLASRHALWFFQSFFKFLLKRYLGWGRAPQQGPKA